MKTEIGTEGLRAQIIEIKDYIAIYIGTNLVVTVLSLPLMACPLRQIPRDTPLRCRQLFQ